MKSALRLILALVFAAALGACKSTPEAQPEPAPEPEPTPAPVETKAAPDPRDYTDARNKLAQRLNDYAWLVGNTEGNVEQALRFSQESLRLRPGTPGYLDTLGRCYYRLGDCENAVKFQRQAVRRDPHSGQLIRQLELFESALADELASES